MQETRPSATAYRVALRRAAHQFLDHPRVFDDPLALAIVGAKSTEAVLARLQGSPASPYLRAFMAVRSRFAEDELAQAVERGVDQYVILGAGLDTFAYRNPYPRLKVFEVDHPATQAWKRTRLEEARIALSASLTFAPVDFEAQTLAEGLTQAGFAEDRPTFFSWLGVVPYLTRSAVMGTLRFVASLPAGSGIAFDYALPPSSLSPGERLAFDALANRVAARGEPFQTFFDPSALAAELRQMGFGHLQDLGAGEINARYFHGRSDGLRVGGDLGHLTAARI